MSIAPQAFEHRTLLHNVSWEMYQSLRAANPSGHLRMTYDRGELDLALEIDVTRSSLPKLSIYPALGVPEVWRWRHETLEILRLDDAGDYQPQSVSVELPSFPFALAIEILGQRDRHGDTTLIRQFIRRIKAKP
jgi:putative restriction endonuclease